MEKFVIITVESSLGKKFTVKIEGDNEEMDRALREFASFTEEINNDVEEMREKGLIVTVQES